MNGLTQDDIAYLIQAVEYAEKYWGVTTDIKEKLVNMLAGGQKDEIQKEASSGRSDTINKS